jgi:hypothetical protein
MKDTDFWRRGGTRLAAVGRVAVAKRIELGLPMAVRDGVSLNDRGWSFDRPRDRGFVHRRCSGDDVRGLNLSKELDVSFEVIRYTVRIGIDIGTGQGCRLSEWGDGVQSFFL